MRAGIGRRSVAAPALIAACVAQAVLEHGGFSTLARIVFVAIAVAAALACGRQALRAMRHPLVAVLLALAALGAASSLWTVGLPEDALAWALLPAGYALLAAAAIGSGTAAPRVVLAAICACAFASGAVGLIGAATFSEPQAFRPVGAWRPAGTLEYAPALALLQVCALPALLRALSRGGRLALLAAPAAVVTGAVLGLSHSRLGVAMALVVAAGSLAARSARGRVGAAAAGGGLVEMQRRARGRAVAAVTLVALAGVAARATVGGAVPAGSEAQAWRLAAVIAGCAAAPLAWLAIERAARRSRPLVLACAVAALVAAGGVGGFAGTLAPREPHASPAGPQHRSHAAAARNDVLHGRRAIWRASLIAFRRRPLQGHGAGSFLSATADLQHPLSTAYAHDLPLELAVELGLPGALLALALPLLAAHAWWRARATPDAWLLGVPALAFLVANLVDWPWHIAGAGAVWAAAAGALVALAPGDRPASGIASGPKRVP
jgi:hypothetical protein